MRRFTTAILLIALIVLMGASAWGAALNNLRVIGPLTVKTTGAVTKFNVATSGAITSADSTTTTGTSWSLTPSALTTGVGLSMTGLALTTGTFIKLVGDASMTTGAFLDCQGGASPTSYFKVGTNGAITQAGVNAAGGSANPYDFTGTLGIMNGSDDFTLFDVNITNADHTSTSNTIQVLDIDNIIGDAHATETAIKIGTGWDTGITSASPITCTSTLSYKTPIVTNTDGSETLDATQSGSLIVCTAAGGATTITLPDPSATTVGCIFYIAQTADQNVDIVPTTANGNSIVADNVATSDKASLATGSHKIGATATIYGISATKWLVTATSPTCPLTVEAND